MLTEASVGIGAHYRKVVHSSQVVGGPRELGERQQAGPSAAPPGDLGIYELTNTL